MSEYERLRAELKEAVEWIEHLREYNLTKGDQKRLDKFLRKIGAGDTVLAQGDSNGIQKENR
jgi:hypothetical protein